MAEQITETFASLGIGKGLVTFIISMLPIIELRGAIPIGVHLGLPLWEAAVISVIGNLVPVPFIIAFIRLIMDWLKRKNRLRRFVAWLEKKGTGPKADRVRRGEFWGLLILVAIPLPGTGAWTGALVAALLDIRMKRALPPIVLGVLAAAVIVSLATAGVIHLVL